MPKNVKTIITIIQMIFSMTEVVTNKYGYPCRDVDSQKSWNTFAAWALENCLNPFAGSDGYMLYSTFCEKDLKKSQTFFRGTMFLKCISIVTLL